MLHACNGPAVSRLPTIPFKPFVTTLFAPVSLVWALACSPPLEDDAASSDPGKADWPWKEGAVVPTEAHLELLAGWDYFHDSHKESGCIAYNAGEIRFRPVHQRSSYDLQYIRSRADLERSLNVNATFEGNAAGASANGKLDLLREFRASSNSVSYLLRATASYVVTSSQGRLSLSEEARELLGQGTGAEFVRFARRCGLHFVRGIEHGGELNLMLTFTGNTEEAIDDIKAAVGLDPGARVPGVKGKAQLETAIQSLASRSDVAVTAKIDLDGFERTDAEGKLIDTGALVRSRLDARSFAVVDKLVDALTHSVDRDWQADRAGYWDNTGRVSGVLGVIPGGYNSIGNWPEVELGEFIGQVQASEDYVRSLGELMERMKDVYFREIEPYLHAPNQIRATYNIAVGTQARLRNRDGKATVSAFVPQSVNDLTAIASQWSDEFLPAGVTGHQVGSTYEEVERRVTHCLSQTQNDALYRCVDSREGELAWREDPFFQKIEAKLAQYHNEGRLLPITYWADPTAHARRSQTFWRYGAEGACDAHAFGGFGPGRLPTVDEARYLTPLVSSGPIDWTDADFDVRYFIWLKKEASHGCGPGEDAFWRARPNEGGTKVCAKTPNSVSDGRYLGIGTKYVAVCVPGPGPLARPIAP